MAAHGLATANLALLRGHNIVRPGAMTCHALRVVRRSAARQVLMRIVARDAAHRAVAAVVAFAIREAVRLKPDIDETVDDGSGGVSAEARARLEVRKLARECFDAGTQLNGSIAKRDIQPANRRVIAHHALVQPPVAFEHPRLGTAAERPQIGSDSAPLPSLTV
jgi:hypothetical protein